METLLEVKDVKKVFYSNRIFGKSANNHVVDGVSFSITKGNSMGLIGESGSGKTTLGRMICGLEKVSSGQIFFKGNDITNLSFWKMKNYLSDIQMIFQNNSTIFDCTYTNAENLREVLTNNMKLSHRESDYKIDEMLDKVGLTSDYKYRYPNQLSGGEKQRINIARALIINPEFVVCDEPVSSLDFSIRKQILDLLNRLKNDMKLTYLFITHDLSTIKYVCDNVSIMYQGKIVEYIEDVNNIENKIKHPYSKILFNSIPSINPEKRRICI